MVLPQELTTVTPVSKTLAVLAFIIIPFIGFFAGIRYGQFTERNTFIEYTVTQDNPFSQNLSNNWQLYTNIKYGISFFAPSILQRCCTISGPLVGNPEKILVLTDRTVDPSIVDQPLNGIAFYVEPNSNKLSFEQYMNQEKKALIQDYLISKEERPTILEEQIIINNIKSVKLKNYTALTPERIYIPFNNDQILIIIKSRSSKAVFDEIFSQILNTIRFSPVTISK